MLPLVLRRTPLVAGHPVKHIFIFGVVQWNPQRLNHSQVVGEGEYLQYFINSLGFFVIKSVIEGLLISNQQPFCKLVFLRFFNIPCRCAHAASMILCAV